MQVVEDEHERARPRDPDQEPGDRVVEPEAGLLAAERLRLGDRGHAFAYLG